MDMCRLVYDAVSLCEIPSIIPTAYLFEEKRLIGRQGLLFIDWDDTEKFAEKYSCSYHPEEIWFGSPRLYITDYPRSSDNYPKSYIKWNGVVVGRRYHAYDTIKMYCALRRNGYPVTCCEYERIYDEYMSST